MKESRSCHTCQRNTCNLMSATCGHKICFNCVKNNKNANKCSICMPPLRLRTPPKKHDTEFKDKSTKIK